MNDPRTWFGPKRIGFGWSPRTWEGWAVIAVLIGAVILLKQILA